MSSRAIARVSRVGAAWRAPGSLSLQETPSLLRPRRFLAWPSPTCADLRFVRQTGSNALGEYVGEEILAAGRLERVVAESSVSCPRLRVVARWGGRS